MQCNLDSQILGKFPALRRLDLSGNAIFGRRAAAVPAGALPGALSWQALAVCAATGSLATLTAAVPTSAVRVRSLGQLSAAAANLTSLAMVQLDNCNVSGNLSTVCGLAARAPLKQLSISSNHVNGSIPACLTNSSTLVELRLDGNALAGSIPAFNAKSPLVYLTTEAQAGPACTPAGHHTAARSGARAHTAAVWPKADREPATSVHVPELTHARCWWPRQAWLASAAGRPLGRALLTVRAVLQAGAGLTGHLPALSKLSALTYMDVSGNSLQARPQPAACCPGVQCGPG